MNKQYMEGLILPKIKFAIFMCSSLILAICIAALVTYRFKNPALTETQLFLNCWKLGLCSLISMCGACLTANIFE